MKKIKPFARVPIEKYFQHDLERIKMADRLSNTILKDLKNIKSAGNIVENALKEFYQTKLFPKYHVTDGHIIDKNLKVSPQFDVIISENSKNPVLFKLNDGAEIVFFEPVYCFAEIKKSFYKRTLITEFSKNIERVKNELKRNDVKPNFVEVGDSGFHLESKLTKFPRRNTLLSFMLFVSSREMNTTTISTYFQKRELKYLPNFVTLLDLGIIINVNEEKYNQGQIEINLYPEYAEDKSIWVIMRLNSENDILTYHYLLLIEHLNNTTVSKAEIREYTKKIFGLTFSNFIKL